jgi:hypothetical protein
MGDNCQFGQFASASVPAIPDKAPEDETGQTTVTTEHSKKTVVKK